jgi:low temperature requirement protein LtrA
VLGVVLFAVAARKTLAHPTEPLSALGRVALGAGVAGVLLTPILGRYRVVGRLAWERIAGMIAAPAAVAVGYRFDSMWLMATVTGILVVVLAIEATRLRQVRA